MKSLKLITAVLFAASALLGAYAQGKTAKANASKSAPMLSSFCGFKAGEDEQTAKKPSKVKDLVGEAYCARKPFRRFKDAILEYDDAGCLVTVQAIARVQKMKFDSAKKELDACCKELSKFGLTFDEEWEETDDVLAQKHGNGRGVDDIAVQCQIDEENEQGVILQITIAWNLRELLHNPQPVHIKTAAFNPKAEVSRMTFAEKAFGVKFGQDLSKSVKLDRFDEEILKEQANLGALIGNSYWLERKLSSPFHGFGTINFVVDGPSEKRLQSISLFPSEYAAKSVDAEKAAHKKTLSGMGKWLGIDDFNTTETTNVQKVDERIDENTVVKAGKTVILDSISESGGLKVKLRSIISVPDKGDISVSREFDISAQ